MAADVLAEYQCHYELGQSVNKEDEAEEYPDWVGEAIGSPRNRPNPTGQRHALICGVYACCGRHRRPIATL